MPFYPPFGRVGSEALRASGEGTLREKVEKREWRVEQESEDTSCCEAAPETPLPGCPFRKSLARSSLPLVSIFYPLLALSRSAPPRRLVPRRRPYQREGEVKGKVMLRGSFVPKNRNHGPVQFVQKWAPCGHSPAGGLHFGPHYTSLGGTFTHRARFSLPISEGWICNSCKD